METANRSTTITHCCRPVTGNTDGGRASTNARDVGRAMGSGEEQLVEAVKELRHGRTELLDSLLALHARTAVSYTHLTLPTSDLV